MGSFKGLNDSIGRAELASSLNKIEKSISNAKNMINQINLNILSSEARDNEKEFINNYKSLVSAVEKLIDELQSPLKTIRKKIF
jgi:cob(I)alamin adenosyltransferase